MKRRGKQNKYRLGSGPVIWVDFKKKPSNEQLARDIARREINRQAEYQRRRALHTAPPGRTLKTYTEKQHKLHDRIFYTAFVALVALVVRLWLFILWRV